MMAQNANLFTHTPLASGCNAALSRLNEMFVSLIPAPIGQGEDPFYSCAVFEFDHELGLLRVAHPLARHGAQHGAVAMIAPAEGARPVPAAAPSVDYSMLMPEVETVFSDGRLQPDALRGACLKYIDILFAEKRADGAFVFQHGILEFLDPADRSRTLAVCGLTNIVARADINSFTADVEAFEALALPLEESPLARELAAGGCRIHLDPAIINATRGFTESAGAPTPYVVQCGRG
jgi:hypothetical protein